eukprot:TRINITY_DN10363_c0_g2_i5.p1 TRINITY_DN10363_c0_g2~~TRINITY_DN10363_c0_g2_i5.p1  ORF type:complete len:117 (+),score=8.34 TRINITY_DN10363_c0_g2_i5:812-1162(+)
MHRPSLCMVCSDALVIGPQLLQHLLEWNRKEGTLYVIEIDDQGRTPCDIARLSSNQACYDLLLEAVAEVKGEADETDAQLVRTHVIIRSLLVEYPPSRCCLQFSLLQSGALFSILY